MANNTSVPHYDITNYLLTEFFSAIYLSLLSPVTVGANSLLLASIYKDPLKCFRTPVTYFIVGLSFVDLLTGLTVEPFFAVFYFTRYFNGIANTDTSIVILRNIAAFISTIGLSSSFLIVLALSCSQFIAINFPHKYKTLITTRRVVLCIVFSFLYFTAFSLINLSKYVSKAVFYQIDLYLHATLIPILLLVSHGFVLFSFYRHSKKSQKNHSNKNDIKLETKENTSMLKSKSKGKTSKHQRQLTIVTLMLSAVLLLCSLPHIIVFYLFLYRYSKPHSFEEEIAINIALRISDDVLFLKVLLDPFIYCWRLPKYRNALKRTLLCLGSKQRGTSNTRDAETQEFTTDQKNDSRSV